MRKLISIVSAVALALLGGVVFIAAAPPAQEESKTEKQIKALTEKIDKLEKRVAELEKKLAEKDPIAKMEERFKGLLDKFGGSFEGGKDGLKKMLEEFRGSMPELPDFDSMPDMLQGLDMDQLLDMLKGQFEGQLPGFFDGLDMDGLLERFKEKLEKKPAPDKHDKKGAPRRRSI
jgi:hypothetical protein